jgi:hypothetical protein
MNTPDRSLPDEVFSIAELEARFEMEAVPVAAHPVLDWNCGCGFER